MHTLKINGLDLSVSVSEHDSSLTGIQYKLIVTLPKRLPQRRKPSIMMQLYGPKPKRPTKPKPDPVAPWVLDIGNALYRELHFQYTYEPWVNRGRGITIFTYHFSCTDTARKLGLEMSEAEYKSRKRWETEARDAGYPNFQRPYL